MAMGHSMMKNSFGSILFASLNVVNVIRKRRVKGGGGGEALEATFLLPAVSLQTGFGSQPSHRNSVF